MKNRKVRNTPIDEGFIVIIIFYHCFFWCKNNVNFYYNTFFFDCLWSNSIFFQSHVISDFSFLFQIFHFKIQSTKSNFSSNLKLIFWVNSSFFFSFFVNIENSRWRLADFWVTYANFFLHSQTSTNFPFNITKHILFWRTIMIYLKIFFLFESFVFWNFLLTKQNLHFFSFSPPPSPSCFLFSSPFDRKEPFSLFYSLI